MNIFLNRLKWLDFCFQIIWKFFLIYEDGKPKLEKRKYWQKILKKYAKKKQFLKVKNSLLE